MRIIVVVPHYTPFLFLTDSLHIFQ